MSMKINMASIPALKMPNLRRIYMTKIATLACGSSF
jgi:hypothetical protein